MIKIYNQIEEEFVKVTLEVRLWFLLPINSLPEMPDSSNYLFNLRKNKTVKSKLSNLLRMEDIIAIFNTSEQSSGFNHEYENWASEPKARTQNVQGTSD
jgi:hypothetical protein